MAIEAEQLVAEGVTEGLVVEVEVEVEVAE